MPSDPLPFDLSTREAGTIRRGMWSPARPELESLPLLVAHGVGDGPTLLVTGGVHGDEYEGPLAIYTLFAGLDPTRLRGRVIGLPIANPAAWQARTRVAPGDGVNLNRIFNRLAAPSTGVGRTPTAILAAAIFETFVRECDLLLDLHSGGAALVHLPLIGWYASEQGDAERLARRFHPALHPWVLPNVAGVLSYEAQRIGKAALGAEWRGGACLDPDGAVAYAQGLRRLLAALGMLTSIEGEAAENALDFDSREPICGDYQDTTQAGLFVPAVRLGQRVPRNALLGTLLDPLGQPTGDVLAVRDGIVAGLPHLPLLQAGDRVAYIG